MKPLILLALVLIFVAPSQAQTQSYSPRVSHFNRIIVSPKINLVVTPGEEEGVRLVYNNVNAGDIRAEVTGHTLHLFLDGARYIQRRQFNRHHSEKMYRNAVVTAYVSCRTLRSLEVRGEEDIEVKGDLDGSKFKLKAYGESVISFNKVNADRFKVVLYGRNKVRINAGSVDEQLYRCYGENRVDASNVTSNYVRSRLYGEDRLQLLAKDEVRITAFGEPVVEVAGGPHLHRGLVIGRASISRR